MVDQAAWGRDQDFRILRQQLHLFRVRHAAQDRHRADLAQVGAVLGGVGGDLQCQFTGWSQHQHFWLGRAEAWTLAAGACRLRFLGCGLAGVAGETVCGQAVQGWQHEGRGLAGAGLRGNQQVLAFNRRRDCLLLTPVGLV